jgi:hypothetical protein
VAFFAPLRFVLRSLGVALRLVSVGVSPGTFGTGTFVFCFFGLLSYILTTTWHVGTRCLVVWVPGAPGPCAPCLLFGAGELQAQRTARRSLAWGLRFAALYCVCTACDSGIFI